MTTQKTCQRIALSFIWWSSERKKRVDSWSLYLMKNAYWFLTSLWWNVVATGYSYLVKHLLMRYAPACAMFSVQCVSFKFCLDYFYPERITVYIFTETEKFSSLFFNLLLSHLFFFHFSSLFSTNNVPVQILMVKCVLYLFSGRGNKE